MNVTKNFSKFFKKSVDRGLQNQYTITCQLRDTKAKAKRKATKTMLI